MVELIIDPEFQGLIPPLTEVERSQLKANLLAEGCQDAVKVWARDGDEQPPVILDGYNRYKICREHNIEFHVIEVSSVQTREEAKIWIIRNQFGRRNLPLYVRTELAMKLQELIAAQAKQQQGSRTDLRQNSGKSLAPIRTDREVAKLADVSHDTVHKVRHIAQKVDEPTKMELRRGKRSIHSAYRSLRRAGRASNGKAVAKASSASTTQVTSTPIEPPPQRHIAQRMIDLAGTMLEALASWRQQFPQDPTVVTFGLTEKHLHDLQKYFREKREEMRERFVWVENPAASADIPVDADSKELAPMERAVKHTPSATPVFGVGAPRAYRGEIMSKVVLTGHQTPTHRQNFQRVRLDLLMRAPGASNSARRRPRHNGLCWLSSPVTVTAQSQSLFCPIILQVPAHMMELPRFWSYVFSLSH